MLIRFPFAASKVIELNEVWAHLRVEKSQGLTTYFYSTFEVVYGPFYGTVRLYERTMADW